MRGGMGRRDFLWTTALAGTVSLCANPSGNPLAAEHLFDLDRDSREEHDLLKDEFARPTLDAWRERLVERPAKRSEGFSKDGKLVACRAYRPLNAGTLTAGA